MSDPRLLCPTCGRPLHEMGLRFSGGKIFPRSVLELKGVEIQGDVLGVDYACLDCGTTLHHPAPPGPATGC